MTQTMILKTADMGLGAHLPNITIECLIGKRQPGTRNILQLQLEK